MEALLLRTRGPEPSAAVERRVAAEARRPPSRLLVLAATLLFGILVVAVVRSAPPPRPGASKDAIRKWTYTCREGGAVVASLSADEAVLENGVLRLRGFTAKLSPSKGEAMLLRSDTARFDARESRITAAGEVGIDHVGGFSSATVDLKRFEWTAVTDLAERFAVATRSTPENYRPKVEVQGASAMATETTIDITPCTVKLKCAGWKAQLTGPKGRSVSDELTLTGGTLVLFEESLPLRGEELILDASRRTLRLTGTFK